MELEHLPNTTSEPDRVPICEICRQRPVRVVAWGEHKLVTSLCDNCNAEEEAQRDAERDRRREDRGRQLRRDLGDRYAAYSFDSYPVDCPARATALARVRDAAHNNVFAERQNLVIFGTVGAAKTSLAVSAARWLVETEAVAARFFVVSEWLGLIRKSFDEPNDAEEIARSAELLVFDDVGGAERMNAFVLEKLGELVDHRYRHRRPMIVTSNKEPAELVALLGREDPDVGQRIVSRLMQDAVAVRLEASDLRIARERAAA